MIDTLASRLMHLNTSFIPYLSQTLVLIMQYNRFFLENSTKNTLFLGSINDILTDDADSLAAINFSPPLEMPGQTYLVNVYTTMSSEVLNLTT